MTLFAIHAPPPDGQGVAWERARAIPTGFSKWGLVFGPLWLLVNMMWLELGAWILGALVVDASIEQGLLRPAAGILLSGLASLFLGFEGRSLKGQAEQRAGRPLVDIVSAARADEAVGVFLSRRVAAPTPPPLPRTGGLGPVSEHVIGLFPEAGR